MIMVNESAGASDCRTVGGNIDDEGYLQLALEEMMDRLIFRLIF